MPLSLFVSVLNANQIKIIGMGQSLSLQVSGIAQQYTLLTEQPAVHVRYGIGGMPYSELAPGTVAYEASVASGGDVVDIIHGERDSGIGTTRAQYVQYLNEWQAAYAADLGFDVPIITDQMSSNGNTWHPELVSQIALAQWDAARLNPHIYLVGPKYQYPYDDTLLHLTPAGNQWNGEQHGKVIAAVLAGVDWRPLEPERVEVEGNHVTIYFYVPVPPLRIDTTTLPERPFYGFEWEDDIGSAIVSVVVGSDRVKLVLDQPTTGGTVRYAYTGTATNASRWGNIKDSDSTPSLTGKDLSNWLVHFEITSSTIYLPIIESTKMSNHGNLGLGNIHRLANWEYATASARTAATGFTADDIGKIAKQTDNNTFWELTAVTPAWLQIGSRSEISININANEENGDEISIDIQIEDLNGDNLEALYGFDIILSDSDTDPTPTTTAPDDMTVGTGTDFFTYITDVMKKVATNDTGYFEVTIAETSSNTWYLWVLMPDGTFAVSNPITFA